VLNDFLFKHLLRITGRDHFCEGTHQLHIVVVWCSVVQSGSVCCSILHSGVSSLRRHSPTTVCCSVLQCVAVCCSVLQCVAVCFSVVQCVAVCGSVGSVAMHGSVLQYIAVYCSAGAHFGQDTHHLQCVTVCDGVLQCVAVCCRVLQYIAGCCSAGAHFCAKTLIDCIW